MNEGKRHYFKIIYNTLLRYIIIGFPILISIERFVPQIATLLTASFLVILIFHSCEKKQFWCKYPIVFMLIFITLALSAENERHVAHLKSIIIFFLALDSYWTGLYERVYSLIINNSQILKIQLWMILFLNVIFLALPYGYSGAYSEEWGVNAYCGIFSDPHQAAYRFCALMVIILITSSVRYSKYDYFLIICSLYLTMMTAARVPSVLALAIAGVFLLDHKPSIKNDIVNKILSFLMLLVFCCIVAYIIIAYTAVGRKILTSLQGVSFDNGRSGLRELDIKLFKQSNLMHKLFGYGTDYVIKYHGSVPYGAKIWSHNDFMAILCGEGVLFLILYCMLWIKQCVYAIKLKNILYLLMIVVCILVAFFNGLYIHPRFVIIMPALFYYMQCRKDQLNVTND